MSFCKNRETIKLSISNSNFELKSIGALFTKITQNTTSPWKPQQTINIERFTAKMSDVEVGASVGVVPKKLERWEREEEAALIELVLECDAVVFGCQKGIAKRRAECWEEVAVDLNS